MSGNKNDRRVERDPQNNRQVDSLAGVYKGVVEDVTDPWHIGRARVRVYSVHGDSDDLATNMIPWAEPMHSGRGGFSPPEIFDQVWVMFENGNKYNPIYLDSNWYSIPPGTGSLPNSRRLGNTTPRVVWHYGPDHYPMARSIFRTGEGDGMWVEDVEFSRGFYGKIVLNDTGGKFLKIATRRIPDPEGAFRYKDFDPEDGNEKGGWGDETVYHDGDVGDDGGASRGEVVLSGAGSTMMAQNETGASQLLLRNRPDTSMVETMAYEGWLLRTIVGNPQGEASQRHELGSDSLVQTPGYLSSQAIRLDLPELW